MGRTISIPLGGVSDGQIMEGMSAAASKIQTGLRSAFGADARIETEVLNAQNEVTADNRSVELKAVHQQVRLRKGLNGANVDLLWNRARAKEIQIKFSTMSVIVDWSFYGVFGLAGVVAVAAGIGMRSISKVMAMAVFATALVVLMVPYYFLRWMLAIKGRPFLDSIESAVRREIGFN